MGDREDIEKIVSEMEKNEIPPLIRKRTKVVLPFDVRFDALDQENLTIYSLKCFTLGELKHCKIQKKHIIQFFIKYNGGEVKYARKNKTYTTNITNLSLNVLLDCLHDFVRGRVHSEEETIEEIREESMAIIRLRKQLNEKDRLIKMLLGMIPSISAKVDKEEEKTVDEVGEGNED